ARDVKQVYAEGASVGDAELMELTVAAFIIEEDNLLKLQANCEALTSDPATRAILCGMLEDETRHVAYLATWLEGFAERFSPRARDARARRPGRDVPRRRRGVLQCTGRVLRSGRPGGVGEGNHDVFREKLRTWDHRSSPGSARHHAARPPAPRPGGDPPPRR